MKLTTSNITQVMVSNKNSNDKLRIPQFIQSPSTTKQVYLYKQTSTKIYSEVKKVKNIQLILTKITPFFPKNFPKKPVDITLIIGKYKTNKYIKLL